MLEAQRHGRQRAKKKLTDIELFAYDLCRAIDCPHPDYLPLTWEQFGGWLIAYEQRPWGDLRDDLRAQVNTVWGTCAGTSQDLPDLSWPYFGEETKTIGERIEWLEKNKDTLLKSAQAKLANLKEARRTRGG